MAFQESARHWPLRQRILRRASASRGSPMTISPRSSEQYWSQSRFATSAAETIHNPLSQAKRCRCKWHRSSIQAHRHAPADVIGDIVIASVTEPLCLGKFDIAVATEVAEHIPKFMANAFAKNLVKLRGEDGIFFTAAAPGQWGDGHINCQPQSYWVALFASSTAGKKRQPAGRKILSGHSGKAHGSIS